MGYPPVKPKHPEENNPDYHSVAEYSRKLHLLENATEVVVKTDLMGSQGELVLGKGSTLNKKVVDTLKYSYKAAMYGALNGEKPESPY